MNTNYGRFFVDCRSDFTAQPRTKQNISCAISRGKYLRLREFGDSLCALGHGVLGKLAREHKSHTRLHLAGGQSGFLVVAGQAACLDTQALEHVLDERVHDGHSALGDAGIGVHLLQHLKDVGGVALDALLLPGDGSGLSGFSFLGGSFNHFDVRGESCREIKKCVSAIAANDTTFEFVGGKSSTILIGQENLSRVQIKK